MQSAAANDPGYIYEVLPGIQPADGPADVTLTEGWHPLPYAEELTGPCLPRRPRTVMRHDLLVLALDFCPLPTTTLPYDSFDPTGAVDQPGRYSVLGADGVVTTYEALRDGTATRLRLHPSDADGADRGDLLLLRPGDLVEWHKSADCFVRYQVTAGPDAAAGTAYREIGVAWMTYASRAAAGRSPPAPPAA